METIYHKNKKISIGMLDKINKVRQRADMENFMVEKNFTPKVFSADEREDFMTKLVSIFDNMVESCVDDKDEFEWLEQLHNQGIAFMAEDFDCVANEAWDFLKEHNLVADEKADEKPINTVAKGYWEGFTD